MCHERLWIVWENEIVGYLCDPIPDMWELLGRWVPTNTPKTEAFVKVVQTFMTKRAYATPDDAIWIDLIDEAQPEGMTPMRAIVTRLIEGKLEVRRVFSKE